MAGKTGNAVAVFAGVLAVSGAAKAQETGQDQGPEVWQSFEITTGVDYSSGDYGDIVDTEIAYFPVTLAYEYGPWRGKATASYMHIKGPGSVVGGGTPVVIGDGQATVGEASGIGDTILSLTYGVQSLWDEGVFLDFTGKVKLPTADEDKGLGTGKTDYTGEIDLAFSLGDFTPFGTLGYRVLGDPDGFALNNTIKASLGGVFSLSDSVSVGGSYDYREASTDFSEAPQEVFGFVNLDVTRNWSLNLYGVGGLSDGSPDYAAGLQITFRTQ